MCWCGSIKDKHIAKKDIHVFKVCRCTFVGDVIPYFKPTCDVISYEEGQMYYEPFGVSPCGGVGNIRIEQGLHSYAIGNWRRLREYTTSQVDGFTIIGSECDYDDPRARIVLCTIPKGFMYYINKNGEIVSNCLRVDKILNTRVAYDNIEEINNKIISFGLCAGQVKTIKL